MRGEIGVAYRGDNIPFGYHGRPFVCNNPENKCPICDEVVTPYRTRWKLVSAIILESVATHPSSFSRRYRLIGSYRCSRCGASFKRTTFKWTTPTWWK